MAQYTALSLTALSRLSASILMVLMATACTIDVDEPVESAAVGTVPVVANEVDQPVVNTPETITPPDSGVNDQPSTTQPEQITQQPGPEANVEPIPNPAPDPVPNPAPDPASNPAPNPTPDPTPDPAPNPELQLDQTGIATSETALGDLLRTAHVVENGQVIPTSLWFCKDVFDVNRSYYFYESGVISPNRAVVVERTLNTDDSFSDISFFWSVTSNDSVLMSSLIAGQDGNLVSSGQQYDMTTIRFTELESMPVFSAQSLLRGALTCTKTNLR